MVNAWELFLKAKLLMNNNNKMACLYEINNSPGKRKYKRNRAGNIQTISLGMCIQKLELDNVIKENIYTLIEIRDNSIHLFNPSNYDLKKKVLEVGTASIKSYVTLANDWFGESLSSYNFFLMPISFFHTYEMESYSINTKEHQLKNLLNFIENQEKDYEESSDGNHFISLVLETRFVRSREPSELTVRRVRNDESADLTYSENIEDHFSNKYPWDYTNNLLPRLKERYSDIKFNDRFKRIKGELENDERFCKKKVLDPNKPKSQSKKFYNPDILKEFDRYYTKK